MCKVICFDLDDTLSKEIEFLKSAYREIAEYAAEHCHGCADNVRVIAHKAYEQMFQTYEKGGNAFQALNVFLGLDLPVKDYLTIYRQHRPKVMLSEEVCEVLTALQASGGQLGLISDGPSLQQWNKIEALGLERWFSDDMIVISESFGSEKPCAANYEYFMRMFPNCKDFTYVGDNPKKDFIAPNVLGWFTICLLDDGCNIHPQDFYNVPLEARPQRVVDSLRDILT